MNTATTPGELRGAASTSSDVIVPRATSLRSEGDVEHAGHDDVVDVRAVPGDEAGVLAALDALADEAVAGRRAGPRRGHDRRPRRPAAMRTASMMPW